MKGEKIKTVCFWIFTSLLVFELIYGALWDLNILNQGYVYNVLEHLGYPKYLGSILAYSKILAAVIIILPGWVLLKEWAYTGIVILFAGAVASHIMTGDNFAQIGFALGFALISVLSWLLRPASRRILSLRNSFQ